MIFYIHLEFRFFFYYSCSLGVICKYNNKKEEISSSIFYFYISAPEQKDRQRQREKYIRRLFFQFMSTKYTHTQRSFSKRKKTLFYFSFATFTCIIFLLSFSPLLFPLVHYFYPNQPTNHQGNKKWSMANHHYYYYNFFFFRGLLSE